MPRASRLALLAVLGTPVLLAAFLVQRALCSPSIPFLPAREGAEWILYPITPQTTARPAARYEAVFRRAGERGVAIEINADPHRIDLDWHLLPTARAAGAMISIGADAHNAAGLEYVTWGVTQARKAWLGPDAILNTRPVAEFLAFARRA